jgi:sulfoxide reductase heme-binding subunit YedZ
VDQQLIWYTIRASGIVTWALVTASVLWGLLLSSRSTRRPRPAWVLDIHRFLAGLSLAFLAVHLGALLADRFVRFSPAAVLVPFVSHWRPGVVASGIVACDLMIIIEITSLVRARMSRRLWHAIHRSSLVVFAAATVHGLTAGTDAGRPLSRIVAFGSIGAVAGSTAFRVFARARQRAPRAVAAGAPSSPPRPTLRPIEDAIAEVRRGAARGGRVARRGDERGRVSRGAPR